MLVFSRACKARESRSSVAWCQMVMQAAAAYHDRWQISEQQMSPQRGKDEANQSTASTQFNNMFTLHTASRVVRPWLEQCCGCSKASPASTSAVEHAAAQHNLTKSGQMATPDRPSPAAQCQRWPLEAQPSPVQTKSESRQTCSGMAFNLSWMPPGLWGSYLKLPSASRLRGPMLLGEAPSSASSADGLHSSSDIYAIPCLSSVTRPLEMANGPSSCF